MIRPLSPGVTGIGSPKVIPETDLISIDPSSVKEVVQVIMEEAGTGYSESILFFAAGASISDDTGVVHTEYNPP